MGRFRDGIHSLLSRSSKKSVTSKKVPKTSAERQETSQKNSQLAKKKSFTSGTGFNVFQARVYTKGERNNYHYTPVPDIKHIPRFQIRVDPPDNIPFQLEIEEQYQNVIIPTITPPASPTQSGFRRPHLKINTTLPGSWNMAPPSPPSSAGAQAPEALLPVNGYEYQSPTRAPPPAPIVSRSPSTPSPLLNASDDILIHVFSHLGSLSAMGSLALTHPRFHNVLVPNKLFILRGIVHNTSPSAYNLVELLKSTEPCTAKSYSEDYEFSLEIVSALKALIQSRCRFFLKSGKMDFSNQTAERAFEDALYNIWAFCIVFRDQAEDISEQMEWLRRFRLGELLDMLEIWQCLGVLLRPLADCPNLAEKYGVIQSRPPSSNYTAEVVTELEEWISFIRTRGLDTLKPIVEWTETQHTQRYAIIVAKRLNKWRKHRNKPHSMFLKDAASRVYGELSLVEESKFVPITPVGSWGPTTDI